MRSICTRRHWLRLALSLAAFAHSARAEDVAPAQPEAPALPLVESAETPAPEDGILPSGNVPVDVEAAPSENTAPSALPSEPSEPDEPDGVGEADAADAVDEADAAVPDAVGESENAAADTVEGVAARECAVEAVEAGLVCERTGMEVERVFRRLDELGIRYDPEEAVRRAIEAALRSVDPGFEDREPLWPASALTNPIIRFEQLTKRIGYVAVGWMGPGVGEQVAKHLLEWETSAPLSGLVFDLRHAGGIDHGSVCRIGGLFVPPDTVLFTVLDTGGATVEVHRAVGPALSSDFLTVVLVDSETRQSAELLAAALRQRGGVMLLGSMTAGDRAIRERIELPGGRVVWMATRRLSVDGEANAPGAALVPDVVVQPGAPDAWVPGEDDLRDEKLSEKTRMDLDLLRRISGDPPLHRAVDIILGLRALGWTRSERERDG